MRIIIEIDPSEFKPQVRTEVTQEKEEVTEALDAGGPPEFLVEALGKQHEAEADAMKLQDEDAGPMPEWLMDAIENVVSLKEQGSNGAGE